MEFNISVIIPVYNLGNFISKAIDSVLSQKYVNEIIIVDDGSTDNTQFIVQNYAEQNPDKIQVITHPDRQNRGLGASRNAGIRAARSEFIAFLDGDDYYLPNRFETTNEVFSTNPDADGVYEVLGTEFRDEAGKYKFSRVVGEGDKISNDYVTKVDGNFAPEELFNVLARKNNGCFSTDTLTLKKSIFKKAGYFKENLRLHGDNEAFLRLAFYGRLVSSGNEEPVAIRVVHERNRMTTQRDTFKRHLFNKEVFKSFHNKNIPADIKKMFFKNYLFGHRLRVKSNVVLKYTTTGFLLLYLILRYPSIISYDG